MVHKLFPNAPCIDNENCLMHPSYYLAHPQISSAPPRNLGGGAKQSGGALSNLGYLCTITCALQQWRNQDFFSRGAAKTAIIHKLNKKNYIVYKNLIIIKTNYIL
jgi:hypothetical protein